MEREDYYFQNLRRRDITPETARKEYNRLRNTVNKRYKRISRAMPKSQLAKRKPFLALSPKASKLDILKALSAVAKAYYSPQGSLTAIRQQRRQNIEIMHEHGYNFINVGNYDQWVNYMEEIRARGLVEMFYSQEHGVDVFGAANKAGVDPEELLDDFGYFAEHYNDFERVARNNKLGGMSSEEIKELMQNQRKRKSNKSK